jgi:hypothetical protein
LNAAFNGYRPAQKALMELVVQKRKEDWPDELAVFAKACANERFHFASGKGGAKRLRQKGGAKRLTRLYSEIGFVAVVLRLAERFRNISIRASSGRTVCLLDVVADAFNKRGIGRASWNRENGRKILKRWEKQKIYGIGDPKLLNVFNILS